MFFFDEKCHVYFHPVKTAHLSKYNDKKNNKKRVPWLRPSVALVVVSLIEANVNESHVCFANYEIHLFVYLFIHHIVVVIKQMLLNQIHIYHHSGGYS